MVMTTLPIANGSYLSESLPISAQECINWYPNVVQTTGLSQETLFGTPGITELATSGEIQQVSRGGHVMAGIQYFVNGDNLYRLNLTVDGGVDTFGMEALGFIEGDGRVSLSDNGTQLLILNPGGKGYIFTEDPDSLVEIADPDFTANGNPQHVVFIDGLFLLTTDSKKCIFSALNDGTSYNALDFFTAEADPDDIVAPVVFKNQLFIGGSETTEGFQNDPAAGFVRTGLFLSKGIYAPFSVVNASDTFMWIGGGTNESPAVWSFQGNTASKISTTAIDFILQGLTDAEIQGVFAWTYAQKGAYFVGFRLPNTTIVYDIITQRWHERQSQYVNGLGQRLTISYRVNSISTAYGRVIVSDAVDGKVGELDPDVYREYGNEIRRVVASQPFQNTMESFLVPSLELTAEAGVGNSDIEDPVITMEISVDGGKTYRSDRSRCLGKVGEYKRRAIWRRNGRMARMMVVRFTLTAAVKPVIIQLTADIEGPDG